jgi:hypothetical protein
MIFLPFFRLSFLQISELFYDLEAIGLQVFIVEYMPNPMNKSKIAYLHWFYQYNRS